MSENKENEQSSQNLPASIPQREECKSKTTRTSVSLDEKDLKKLDPQQEKNKPIFSKLLHQPEIYERLSRVAKGINKPVNKFLKILLNQLCDGSLKWSGVVAVSFGLLQFGSVFMYSTFQHESQFHNAILATHEHVIIPDTLIFNPKNMELYRKLQKTLLAVVTSNDILFETEDHTKFKSQKAYKVAQLALGFNTAYAIAQYCEKDGSEAMLEVADECYRWILRHSVQARSTLTFQTKEFSSFVDLCSPRFLEALRSNFGKPKQSAPVEAKAPAESLPSVEEVKLEEQQPVQEQQEGTSV